VGHGGAFAQGGLQSVHAGVRFLQRQHRRIGQVLIPELEVIQRDAVFRRLHARMRDHSGK
jgi:hypothetical protein